MIKYKKYFKFGDIMKTILITGASRGLGAAIAKKLAKDNNIIINYKNSEKEALALEKELSIYSNVKSIKADVSNINEVENMFDEIKKCFGGVDILINNAGISKVGLFQDMPVSEFKEIFDVNVFGVYNTIQFTLPHMLSKKSGSILNISSIWGSNGASCEVAYSATKGAIESLTKSLAVELAPSNIKVNAIAPGVINTDMMKEFSDSDLALIKDDIPMMRLAEASEVAELAAFLVSDKNSYMTGQIISIDGGMCV